MKLQKAEFLWIWALQLPCFSTLFWLCTKPQHFLLQLPSMITTYLAAVAKLKGCQQVSQHRCHLAIWLLLLQRRIYNCLVFSVEVPLWSTFPLPRCYISQVCKKYLHIPLYPVSNVSVIGHEDEKILGETSDKNKVPFPSETKRWEFSYSNHSRNFQRVSNQQLSHQEFLKSEANAQD